MEGKRQKNIDSDKTRRTGTQRNARTDAYAQLCTQFRPIHSPVSPFTQCWSTHQKQYFLSPSGHCVQALESEWHAPASSEVGIHPMHYAASTGDKKSVVSHLKAAGGAKGSAQYKAMLNSKDNYGRTALTYSVVSGKLNLAKWLVDQGADVNSVDNEGRSALHWVRWCSIHCSQRKEALLLTMKENLPLRFSSSPPTHLCLYFQAHVHALEDATNTNKTMWILVSLLLACSLRKGDPFVFQIVFFFFFFSPPTLLSLSIYLSPSPHARARIRTHMHTHGTRTHARTHTGTRTCTRSLC